MFPVWINDGTTEMPDDSILYIISKSGTYLKKKLGIFESLSKVDKISILEDCKSYAKMDIRRLKTKNVGQIVSFFREVYQKYKAEANIILHYHPEKKAYKIDIPPQGATGASVDYINGEYTFQGFIRIGTIHSHASMSAFHSGVDHNDEENWDGLHITIGYLHRKYIDISASIMANGKRFNVNPMDYMCGIELVEFEEKSPAWMGKRWINGKWIENKPTKTLGYLVQDVPHPIKWSKKIEEYRPIAKHNHGYTYHSSEEFLKRFDNNIFDFGDGIIFGDISNSHEKDYTHRIEIGEDEWNACQQCPYRHHKIDLVMKDVLEAMDDEDLERLGFKEEDDDKEDDPDSAVSMDQIKKLHLIPDEKKKGGNTCGG